MLQARARWVIPTVAEDQVRELMEGMSISERLARLLIIRGIHSVDAARAFLHTTEDELYDPFLLDGMDLAVPRIERAIEQGELIRIYGDYDADGVSSTSLMIGLLRQLGANFDYYIPHRRREGYGLNIPALELAQQQGVGLIITVDTGISAVEQALAAKRLGMDLIVTDHHEPPDTLPETYATINPKKPGCSYPFKSLAGVGVAFKLAQALLRRVPHEWFSLAAIGTIADLMPLLGENRVIVKLGMQQIRTSASTGIRALLTVSNIEQKEATVGHIGFSVAPRINASGRLESADTAVQCLITDNNQEAEQLAQELDRINRERQAIVEDIASQAFEQVEQQKLEAGELGHVLVLAGEGWNVGVVGIVASKVLERYYRPTIILSIDTETGLAKGSARSIAGFDMYAALTACREQLKHFGGHQAAAGMTLDIDQISQLRSRLQTIAARELTPEALIPIQTPDMEISFEEISVEGIAELELIGPFGMCNPAPSFVINGLQVQEAKLLGKDRQHLKLSLTSAESSSPPIDGLAFGKADLARRLSLTDKVDLYAELSINEWNGKRRPQILIRDLRVTEQQVFDWRGKSIQDEAISEWLSTESELSGDKAILIFHPHELALLPEHTRQHVWLFDGGATPSRWAGEQWRSASLPAADEPPAISEVMWLTLPASELAAEQARAYSAKADRLFAVFHDTKSDLSGVMPDREQFRMVYGTLAALTEPALERQLYNRLRARNGIAENAARFILRVFKELGFVRLEAGGYSLVTAPPKRELSEAPSYQEKLYRDSAERIYVYSTSQELKDWLLVRVRANAMI